MRVGLCQQWRRHLNGWLVLEGKLDEVEVDESKEVVMAGETEEMVEETPVRSILAGGFKHRRAWIAAASVIILLSAGAVIVQKSA